MVKLLLAVFWIAGLPWLVSDGQAEESALKASKTELQPELSSSIVAGLKLTSVQADSIWFKLGFRTGDVIRKCNGMAFSEEMKDKFMACFSNDKNDQVTTIEFTRNGERKTAELKWKAAD